MILSREKLKNYVQYRKKLTGYTLHATIDRTLDNPDNAVKNMSYSKNTLKVTTDSGRTYEVVINRGDVIKLNRKYIISSFEKDDTNEDYNKFSFKNYDNSNAGAFNVYKNGDPNKDIDKSKILSKVTTDNSDSTKVVHNFEPYTPGIASTSTIETPKNGFQSKYDVSKVISSIVNNTNENDDYNTYVLTSYDKSKSYTINTTKTVYNFMDFSTFSRISADEKSALNFNYYTNDKASSRDPASTRIAYRKNPGGYAYFQTRDVASINKTNVSYNYEVKKIIGNNGIDTDIIDFYRYDQMANKTNSITLNKLSTDNSGKDIYGSKICPIIVYKKGLNNHGWNTLNNFVLNIEQSKGNSIDTLYTGDNIMTINLNNTTINLLNVNETSYSDIYVNQSNNKTSKKFIGESYYYDEDSKNSLSIKAILKPGLNDNWYYLNLYVTDLSNGNIFNTESGKKIEINNSPLSFNMTRYAYAK